MARTRHIASEHGPHPIDVHVGQRVRSRRLELGMSQEKLGTSLGLTFQQIQKYERGANRIGCSRLFEISQLLGVDPDYFFVGVDQDAGPGMAEAAQQSYETDIRLSRDTQELLRAYSKISDARLRRRVLELAKTLAEIPAAQ